MWGSFEAGLLKDVGGNALKKTRIKYNDLTISL